MLDPVLLFVLATLSLIGSVIGIVTLAGKSTAPRRKALDIGLGALAALAIGFPAVSHAATGMMTPVAVIGAPEPWLLSLGAYMCGALITLSVGQLMKSAKAKAG